MSETLPDDIIVGVDTHKHIHAAVAITALGARLGTLTIPRDTAIKARTQAMHTLKALSVTAPLALRERLEELSGKMTLIRHVAALRPGPLVSTTASANTQSLGC